MPSTPVRWLALGAVLVTAAWFAAPARAVDVGDPAPDIEGKEFFNTEPLSLKDLRGRVVLLELFSVT